MGLSCYLRWSPGLDALLSRAQESVGYLRGTFDVQIRCTAAAKESGYRLWRCSLSSLMSNGEGQFLAGSVPSTLAVVGYQKVLPGERLIYKVYLGENWSADLTSLTAPQLARRGKPKAGFYQ